MISPTLITWIVVIVVFGIVGLGFYLDNKEINQKKKPRPSKIIHFNHNGRYACNEAIPITKEKLTEDWEKVTCKNCPRVKFYY